MDPEQLEIILGYTAFVVVASVLLQSARPAWSRIRIAFLAGGLLPLGGLSLGSLALLRWINAPPLPNDTDHQAMAVIGIAILLILSAACLVIGMAASLIATTVFRRQAGHARDNAGINSR